MIYSREEVVHHLTRMIANNDPADLPTDIDGQLVIYTRLFRWNDGSFHDHADPSIDIAIER